VLFRWSYSGNTYLYQVRSIGSLVAHDLAQCCTSTMIGNCNERFDNSTSISLIDNHFYFVYVFYVVYFFYRFSVRVKSCNVYIMAGHNTSECVEWCIYHSSSGLVRPEPLDGMQWNAQHTFCIIWPRKIIALLPPINIIDSDRCDVFR
jgi:hypothetical protein